jgi:hypothetical protein
MSTVDLRGFAYPLQALVQRKQWQVEKRQRELAAALRSLQQADQAHTELAALCSSHTELARRAWRDRTDPASYQRQLAHLARQQASKTQLEARLQQLRLAHQQAQGACVASQLQLDGLCRHRQDCQHAYAAGERSRQLAQADQDWIARLHLTHTRVNP